jgi:hypothetical protein
MSANSRRAGSGRRQAQPRTAGVPAAAQARPRRKATAGLAAFGSAAALAGAGMAMLASPGSAPLVSGTAHTAQSDVQKTTLTAAVVPQPNTAVPDPNGTAAQNFSISASSQLHGITAVAGGGGISFPAQDLIPNFDAPASIFGKLILTPPPLENKNPGNTGGSETFNFPPEVTNPLSSLFNAVFGNSSPGSGSQSAAGTSNAQAQTSFGSFQQVNPDGFQSQDVKADFAVLQNAAFYGQFGPQLNQLFNQIDSASAITQGLFNPAPALPAPDFSSLFTPANSVFTPATADGPASFASRFDAAPASASTGTPAAPTDIVPPAPTAALTLDTGGMVGNGTSSVLGGPAAVGFQTAAPASGSLPNSSSDLAPASMVNTTGPAAAPAAPAAAPADNTEAAPTPVATTPATAQVGGPDLSTVPAQTVTLPAPSDAGSSDLSTFGAGGSGTLVAPDLSAGGFGGFGGT